MSWAKAVLIAEEISRHLKRKEKRIKKQIIIEKEIISTPRKVIDEKGKGTLVEAVVKLSSKNAEIRMVVDNVEVIPKWDFDTVTSYCYYYERISAITNENIYILHLKNIDFEKNLILEIIPKEKMEVFGIGELTLKVEEL